MNVSAAKYDIPINVTRWVGRETIQKRMQAMKIESAKLTLKNLLCLASSLCIRYTRILTVFLAPHIGQVIIVPTFLDVFQR